MNVVSLCSGVGGLDRGLENAGATVVAHCELDPHARSVLARHWPDVPCHEDITTFDGSQWRGRVDLVAGGTPCTDLSVAGRRAGLVGDESRLFWDFCRVADQSAADWVLWENVAGALSSPTGARGEDFAAVLWGFTGFRPSVPADGWRSIGVCIGPRRTAVWRVLDARWFGVAQRRRRVFVVASARADRVIPVLVEPESVPRGPRPGGETGQVVAALTATGADGRGWRLSADDAASGHLVVDLAQITSPDNRSNPQPGDPAPSLAATSRPIAFGWSNAATQGLAAAIDNAPTLRAKMQPAVAFSHRGRGDELGEPDIMTALRAGDGGASRCPTILTPDFTVRRLTPREEERLMGWPDDWTRWAADGTEIADSHRYRLCGNGVVSPNAEWIGRRLMRAAA